VRKYPEGPALGLLQGYCGRTNSELFGAQQVICRRGTQECRAGAPDDAAAPGRLFWREEEALRDVSEPCLTARPYHVMLGDERNNRARDQVPVLRDRDR